MLGSRATPSPSYSTDSLIKISLLTDSRIKRKIRNSFEEPHLNVCVWVSAAYKGGAYKECDLASVAKLWAAKGVHGRYML